MGSVSVSAVPRVKEKQPGDEPDECVILVESESASGVGIEKGIDESESTPAARSAIEDFLVG